MPAISNWKFAGIFEIHKGKGAGGGLISVKQASQGQSARDPRYSMQPGRHEDVHDDAKRMVTRAIYYQMLATTWRLEYS